MECSAGCGPPFGGGFGPLGTRGLVPFTKKRLAAYFVMPNTRKCVRFSFLSDRPIETKETSVGGTSLYVLPHCPTFACRSVFHTLSAERSWPILNIILAQTSWAKNVKSDKGVRPESKHLYLILRTSSLVVPQKYQNGVRDPSPGRAAGGSARKTKRQCPQ